MLEDSARFEALLCALPALAQGEFRRRVGSGSPPATPHELFEAVRSWLNDASIAEARGGYPGGRGKLGWTDYVTEQRRGVAVLHGLVDAFGAPAADVMDTLLSYERSFPAAVRRMGEGYEPYVDDEAGRLIYSLPVDSGFVSLMFAFEITEDDFQILLADEHRRAILAVIAHSVLQHSLLRDRPEVNQPDFRRLLDRVLHSSQAGLADIIAEIDRKHNIDVASFVSQAQRRGEPGSGSRS